MAASGDAKVVPLAGAFFPAGSVCARSNVLLPRVAAQIKSTAIAKYDPLLFFLMDRVTSFFNVPISKIPVELPASPAGQLPLLASRRIFSKLLNEVCIFIPGASPSDYHFLPWEGSSEAAQLAGVPAAAALAAAVEAAAGPRIGCFVRVGSPRAG